MSTAQDVAAEAAAQATAHLDDVDGFDDAALDAMSGDPEPDPEPAAAAPDLDPAPAAPDATPDPAPKPAPDAKADDDKTPTPDAKADATPKPAPAKDKGGKGGHMLPKARYDYQRTKRAEAEERAAQLEEKQTELEERITELTKAQETAAAAAAAQDTEALTSLEEQLDAKIDEVEALRVDGKAKEAASVQREIRKIEREIGRMEAAPAADTPMATPEDIRVAALSQMRAEIALDAAIDKVEEAYPQLKEGNEAYNKDLVEEVMDVYDALLARGKTTPANAMTRAVGLVAGDPVEQKAANKRNGRKQDAVARNIKDAGAQPPDLNDAGMDADKGGPAKPLDIANMSIEEFESLGVSEDSFLP